jgi:formate hydrogenlyase transcriptional activator
MVARKEFRSDLYYRLNVFPVALPPLRERRQDIPQLTSHFVDIYARRMGKQIDHIPQDMLAAFTSYSWPGNVRELQNLVERAVIRSNNGVLANPLVVSERLSNTPVPTRSTFSDSQRALILSALQNEEIRDFATITHRRPRPANRRLRRRALAELRLSAIW